MDAGSAGFEDVTTNAKGAKMIPSKTRGALFTSISVFKWHCALRKAKNIHSWMAENGQLQFGKFMENLGSSILRITCSLGQPVATSAAVSTSSYQDTAVATAERILLGDRRVRAGLLHARRMGHCLPDSRGALMTVVLRDWYRDISSLGKTAAFKHMGLSTGYEQFDHSSASRIKWS